MGVRVQVQPHSGESNFPLCACWDATLVGQAASLANGVTRPGTPLEVSGFRRYRLKVFQITGAGPTQVVVQDIPFDGAAVWENLVLAAAQATGVRSVYNF